MNESNFYIAMREVLPVESDDEAILRVYKKYMDKYASIKASVDIIIEDTSIDDKEKHGKIAELYVGYPCIGCGSKLAANGVHIHHHTYHTRRKWRSPHTHHDVNPLCETCHAAIHTFYIIGRAGELEIQYGNINTLFVAIMNTPNGKRLLREVYEKHYGDASRREPMADEEIQFWLDQLAG